MTDQTIHYPVKRLVSLQRALQELQPFVQDRRYLRSGRGIRNFGDMRPREFLANWLVCAVSTDHGDSHYSFTTDPLGGDGIIRDDATGETFRTEHVAVLLPPNAPTPVGQAENLILDRITEKNARGPTYASGQTLIVFMEEPAGPWLPNRVTRSLPAPLHYDAVWVVGLQSVEADGTYVYGVTWLQLGPYIDAPTFLVRVAPTFTSWAIERLQ